MVKLPLNELSTGINRGHGTVTDSPALAMGRQFPSGSKYGSQYP